VKTGLWERCGAEATLRALSLFPFRVVEAQHLSSTRALVDSSDEHAVLEELIERAKPPAEPKSLHFLLSTPFRYPPLRHGSRFGRPTERGIWYGSESSRTAFAESAYYRLLFLEGSRAKLGQLSFELSLFRARVRTKRGVDLTKSPFAKHRRALASKTDYSESQRLGASLREARVEVVRYESARDPAGGRNVAVLTPAAFVRRAPDAPETWVMTIGPAAVDVVKKSFHARKESFVFRREDFLVRGALPKPAL
jgi:RES domain